MPERRTIQVTGMDQFLRELARARVELSRELARADHEAAERVGQSAQRRAPRGPHQGGGAVTPVAESVHWGTTPAGGFIGFGGPSSPHAPPIEFGGTLARRGSQARTEVPARSYVYAAIAAESEAVLDIYWGAADRTLRRAFPRGRL